MEGTTSQAEKHACEKQLAELPATVQEAVEHALEQVQEPSPEKVGAAHADHAKDGADSV